MYEITFSENDIIITLYVVVCLIATIIYIFNKNTKKNNDKIDNNSRNDFHDNKIDILKNINNSYYDINDELSRTKDKIIKGVIGEELIVTEIKKIDIYHKIVQNVYIDMNNKKTEIDIILITCVGLFVIESKNYSGIIFGKQNDIYWTQFLNHDNKNKFNNPINQNQYHINFLSNYLKKDESIFYSYIVFGDDTNINKIVTDTSVKVINNKNLLKYITDDIHNNDISLSNEEIDKIYVDLKYYKEHSR